MPRRPDLTHECRVVLTFCGWSTTACRAWRHRLRWRCTATVVDLAHPWDVYRIEAAGLTRAAVIDRLLKIGGPRRPERRRRQQRISIDPVLNRSWARR